MSTKLDITQSIAVIMDIQIWCGEATANRKNDLKNADPELPPDQLYKGGKFRLVDGIVTSRLDTFRRKADRAIDTVGMKCRNLCFVPDDAFDALSLELQQLKDQFDEYCDNELVGKLDQHYEDWAAKFPTWTTELTRHHLTKPEVRASCRFDWFEFRLAPPKPSEPDSVANQRFKARAARFVEDLLLEMAAEAGKRLENVVGKSSIPQAQAQTVRDSVKRLRGFAAADLRILRVGNYLQSELDQLPKTGPLQGADALRLIGVLKSLSDPDFILLQGEGLMATPAVIEVPQASLPLVDIVDTLPVAPVLAPQTPSSTAPRSRRSVFGMAS